MIDWLLLLKFANQQLKIPPSEFWQMTLKEFMAIADIKNQQSTICESDIKLLKKRFKK